MRQIKQIDELLTCADVCQKIEFVLAWTPDAFSSPEPCRRPGA
jgi:hypothetical protein